MGQYVPASIDRSIDRRAGRVGGAEISMHRSTPPTPPRNTPTPNNQQQEEPIGAPAPGHIRVAVKAIGLNLADVFAIIGLYSATPKGRWVLGFSTL